jgi:uncharacterized protein
MLTSRTVTTTGHGRVSLPRTSAVVRVGAAHQAGTLADALAGAESGRAAVVDVARRHVDAAAVSSRSLDVWPAHDTPGFEARHTLAIRCADPQVAARVVQDLADEVGDRLRLDGVTLAAAPTEDDVRTARERAFADARHRAEHLAELAGTSLGSVVSVVEGTASTGGGPGPLGLAAKTDAALEPGEEDLTATLTVVWELG